MSFSILTHWDLDGVGCAILLHKAFSKHINETYACGYGKIDKKLNQLARDGEQNIIITDLNLTEDQYNFVHENFQKYFIIDHHADTENFIKDKNVRFSLDYSGTALVWRWLKKEKNIKLDNTFLTMVKLINDYDLYTLKDPRSVVLNEMFWSFEKFCFYPFLKRFTNKFQPTEKEWLKARKSLNQKIKDIKNSEHYIIEDKMLIAYNIENPNEVSLVWPDLEYYLIFRKGGGISIRSKNKSLLPLYAKLNTFKKVENANGHAAAGGILLTQYDEETVMKFAEFIYKFMEKQ